MLRLGPSLFAAVVLLAGCVATDDSYDEAESVAAADGKADATSELRVRAWSQVTSSTSMDTPQ